MKENLSNDCISIDTNYTFFGSLDLYGIKRFLYVQVNAN
jgi:hypothetical protein